MHRRIESVIRIVDPKDARSITLFHITIIETNIILYYLDDAFKLTIDQMLPPLKSKEYVKQLGTPFPVDSYKNEENMWELIGSI